MAPFIGEGGSNELAQDFWTENLFDPKMMVAHHWLKLLWVYCVSGITQLTLTSVLLMIPITLYKNGGSDWTYAFIAIAGATLISWFLAIIFATVAWLDIKSKIQASRF